MELSEPANRPPRQGLVGATSAERSVFAGLNSELSDKGFLVQRPTT